MSILHSSKESSMVGLGPLPEAARVGKHLPRLFYKINAELIRILGPDRAVKLDFDNLEILPLANRKDHFRFRPKASLISTFGTAREGYTKAFELAMISETWGIVAKTDPDKGEVIVFLPPQPLKRE